MADISTLRRQRGHIQATMTTLTNLLEQWDSQQETCDIDLLQISFDTMKRAYNKFGTIQNDLEDLDEAEADKRTLFIGLHNKAVARFRSTLRESQPTIPTGNSPFVSSATRQTKSVTLPTISLPTFNGTSDQWESFYDMFNSIIHQNEDLPSVQKLQYLKASLKGEAAATMQSLETTGTNYETAIQLLKEKFEGTKQNLIRHCKILREYPRLLQDTPAAIFELVNIFNQHLRALENAKIDIKSWDLWLVELILSKLGQQTVWQWELSTDDEIPSHIKLLKFLDKRANCALQNNHLEQYEQFHRKTDKTTRSTSSKPSYHTFATTYSNNSRSYNEPKCGFCSQKHTLYQCDQFRDLNVEERRQSANELNLCFNCSSPGHRVQNCKSSSCRLCNRRHNTLLHPSANIDEAKGSINNSATSENSHDS